MARTVGLRGQNFEDLITKDYFYVDKTGFIKEWWENGEAVMLLIRPRCFEKTLNMVSDFTMVLYWDFWWI